MWHVNTEKWGLHSVSNIQSQTKPGRGKTKQSSASSTARSRSSGCIHVNARRISSDHFIGIISQLRWHCQPDYCIPQLVAVQRHGTSNFKSNNYTLRDHNSLRQVPTIGPLSNGNSMASAARLHSNQFNSSGKVYMVYLYGLPQRKGKQYCNISARIELQHKWNGIRENRWILLPLYTGIKHVAIQNPPAPIKLKRHWWQEKKM